ncbi:MAG: DNA helicase II [Pseudomonadota bacterium]
MDVTYLLDALNSKQRDAVSAPPGNLLILAGAGSGKTRVLTHRIAWLNAVENVSPFGVLAVTFTNKAASEMRGRLESMLDRPLGPMWVGTFHGLAHRMLRQHWQDAKLPQGFQILDADDQLRLVKRLVRGLNLDEAAFPPRQAVWFINARKDEGLRAAHLDTPRDEVQQQFQRIYTAYEGACERAGAVDFAELLLRSLELLRDNAPVREHYQRRFSHLLIDEFQDTNEIQYAWLRTLAGPSCSVFAVGDDDQSIYGWRGARIENMHNFREDFANVEVVRLEQNYRSTGTILKAANALIEHNAGRLGKNLWTDAGNGEAISFYTAFDERDEARFVVERVKNWVEQGGRRDECAVLYRSNAQSRVLEEAMITANLPYRVYGGMRFFERAEIKDALAYLRLVCNRDDDVSFERVVNQPTRGIGERSVAQLRELARDQGLSLWQAAGQVSGRAGVALTKFLTLVDALAAQCGDDPLADQIDTVIAQSGLLAHYQKDESEKGQARVENLEELVGAARVFSPDSDAIEALSPLEMFLAQAALDAGDAQGEAWEDCVQLMTLHSAKGLEYPVVFMVGMEEGLFPHQRTLEDPSQLEEERRIAYVGITRAREKLYLCQAENRRLHGRELFTVCSRFVGELPGELIDEIRPQVQVTRPVYQHPERVTPSFLEEQTPYAIGQRVLHNTFGEGVVTGCEGQGKNMRMQVNFEAEGQKWLVLAYANLTPLA